MADTDNEDDVGRIFSRAKFTAMGKTARLEYLKRFYKNVHALPMLRIMADKGWGLPEIRETLPEEERPSIESLRIFCLNAEMIDPKKDSAVVKAVIKLSNLSTYKDLCKSVTDERYRLLKLKYDGRYADALVRHIADTGETLDEMIVRLPSDLKVVRSKLSKFLSDRHEIFPYTRDRKGHNSIGRVVAYLLARDINELFPLDKAPPIKPTGITARNAANAAVAPQPKKIKPVKFHKTTFVRLDKNQRVDYLKTFYPNVHAIPIIEILAERGIPLSELAEENAVNFSAIQQFLSEDTLAPQPDSQAIQAITKITGLSFLQLMEAVWEERYAALKRSYPGRYADALIVHMAKTGDTLTAMTSRLPDSMKATDNSFYYILSGKYTPYNKARDGYNDTGLAVAWILGQDASVLFPLSEAIEIMRDGSGEPQYKTHSGYAIHLRRKFKAAHAAPFLSHLIRTNKTLLTMALEVRAQKEEVIKFLQDEQEAYSPTNVERHSHVGISMCQHASVPIHQLFPLQLHPKQTDEMLREDGRFIRKYCTALHAQPFVQYMSENLLTFQDLSRRTGHGVRDIKRLLVDKKFAYEGNGSAEHSDICKKLCALVGIQNPNHYFSLLEHPERNDCVKCNGKRNWDNVLGD